MFWGLIMEPGRCYTQTVKKAFHISMAALDISNAGKEPSQVMCVFDGRNYLLCTLNPKERLQCQLDLNFEEGTKVSFAVNGDSHVHLTGYLVPEEEPLFGPEEEEEEEAENEEVIIRKGDKKRNRNQLNASADGPPKKKSKKESKSTASLLDEYAAEDEDADETFDIKKYEEEFFKKSATATSDDDDDEEDEDAEEDEDEDSDEDEVEGESAEDESSEQEVDEESDDALDTSEDEDNDVSSLSGEEEKQQAVQVQQSKPKVNGIPKKDKEADNKTKQQKKKEKKQEQQASKPAENKQKPDQKKPKTKKTMLKGGILVEDLKEGTGDLAKPGKLVHVYYEGRLKDNNKLFDSNNKGPGFKFRLGKSEVIKGWDIGLNGMKVGGKRRITCPPGAAYGQKGSPPVIPPNSTLVFEVELKKIT